MDNPPHNLFDEEMWQAWFAAVDWLEHHVPRALLIRAEGRVVSAGVDVRIFRDTRADEIEEYWRRNLRIVQAVERLPCPTVFAAHSLTLTAAFEIALACDFIVAVGGARFGLVERRVAFTPAMGGTQRLAERAGVARARELVMTGKLCRASTLAGWGLSTPCSSPRRSRRKRTNSRWISPSVPLRPTRRRSRSSGSISAAVWRRLMPSCRLRRTGSRGPRITGMRWQGSWLMDPITVPGTSADNPSGKTVSRVGHAGERKPDCGS
ncbi:enoyl-CoA hydratase/isomerase family protein [Streptomyces turgidiscabies]